MSEFLQRREELTTPEKLPPLQADFVRLIHITRPEAVSQIQMDGLKYNGGMISSTARYWSNASECEYGSTDPRFSFPEAVAIVMDVPMAEIRTHNDPTKAPGVIPARYFVGAVEAK